MYSKNIPNPAWTRACGTLQHHGSRAGCPQWAMESAGPLNIYCVLPESGVVLQSERFWQFLKEERQEKKVSGA